MQIESSHMSHEKITSFLQSPMKLRMKNYMHDCAFYIEFRNYRFVGPVDIV